MSMMLAWVGRQMHRSVLASFLLIFASGVSQTFSSREPSTVPDLVKRTRNAVVQIVASDDTGTQKRGSGFFVSKDGKVVTNLHVIESANSAIAKLADGKFLAVKGILAQDSNKDLVVLQVDGGNHESLHLDSTFDLRVGDHVVAIGSPLGFEGTVSDGIVSAIRRDEEDRTWIQTTAPISHGNSGGPLLNMHGNVVGVIARGMNPGEGQNLNFAIPAYEVAQLLSFEEALRSSNIAVDPLGNDCTDIAKTLRGNLVERPGELLEEIWQKNLERAEQGDIGAESWLAQCYQANSAISSNADVARAYWVRGAYWYCRAAAQGDAEAQWQFASLFRKNYGVSADLSKTQYWLRVSARQGWAPAQVELGELESDFNDFEEAYFWLSVGLAAPQMASWGNLESLRKKRDEAATHFSYAQSAQVQERVRKWLEEHTPKLSYLPH